MDANKFFKQQAPVSNRRSSYMFIKDNKIISADDYFATKVSVQNESLEAHRKRSFSAGAVINTQMAQKFKSKIPNFKKYHEQQFEKMESLSDYTVRKAERAKKLMTPPKLIRRVGDYSPPTVSQINTTAIKRSLSINYKNIEEHPNKKIKYDSNVIKKESTSPNSQLNGKSTGIQSFTSSWLKGVKLNKRFQLLMNYQKKV